MTQGPVIRAGASLTAIGQQAPRVHSVPAFYEDWRGGFLDVSKWNYAVTNGGEVIAGSGTSTPGIVNSLALRQTVAVDTSALVSRDTFVIPHGQTALTTIQERLHLEFLYINTAVAAIDNSTTFMGLSSSAGATRATNNIIGFYFDADVLRAIVDSAGTETTSALTTAPTVTALHKYHISIDYLNGVRFYVDDVLQATITTNIPNTLAHYIRFYAQGDSAAGNRMDIGMLRLWMEDLI